MLARNLLEVASRDALEIESDQHFEAFVRRAEGGKMLGWNRMRSPRALPYRNARCTTMVSRSAGASHGVVRSTTIIVFNRSRRSPFSMRTMNPWVGSSDLAASRTAFRSG